MTAPRPRVAVIGAGVSGLGAAHALKSRADVVLFEADARCGGHAHTVDVTLDGVTHGVDTGFLVHNHRTYPRLLALFAELGVQTTPAEMSFSVQAPDPNGRSLEWSGRDLAGVFAQRANLVRPGFLGMLTDIVRFNRLATGLARRDEERALAEPLGDFLDRHRFGATFRNGYLLPMIGCIWSCPTEQMLRFPVATLIRFCHNHGLLQVSDRPTWYAMKDGSRHYVDAIVRGLPEVRTATPVLAVEPRRAPGDGVVVESSRGRELFDEVVLACHAPQSLRMLERGGDTDAARRRVLAALRTQRNEAVLHTDATLLPTRPAAWAAWNYERAFDAGAASGADAGAVCLHYLINRLQTLPWTRPVIVSLNPLRAPRPQTVLGRFDYAHPVFDQAAIAAQARVPALQGAGGVWLCGAWTGYGFHEDGLRSGQDVAAQIVSRCDASTPQAARPPLREAA
jgi:predicted NAD/FAD-binding protein